VFHKATFSGVLIQVLKLILVRLVILPNIICTLEYYSDNLAYTLSIIAMGDTEFIKSPQLLRPQAQSNARQLRHVEYRNADLLPVLLLQHLLLGIEHEVAERAYGDDDLRPGFLGLIEDFEGTENDRGAKKSPSLGVLACLVALAAGAYFLRRR
jgi:hypothetical protein